MQLLFSGRDRTRENMVARFLNDQSIQFAFLTFDESSFAAIIVVRARCRPPSATATIAVLVVLEIHTLPLSQGSKVLDGLDDPQLNLA